MMRMLRFFRRKIRFCIFIVAAFAILKLYLPDFGSRIGSWISGTQDSRVVQAFSEMLNAFSEGDSVREAVEVFCDGLQEN